MADLVTKTSFLEDSGFWCQCGNVARMRCCGTMTTTMLTIIIQTLRNDLFKVLSWLWSCLFWSLLLDCSLYEKVTIENIWEKLPYLSFSPTFITKPGKLILEHFHNKTVKILENSSLESAHPSTFITKNSNPWKLIRPSRKDYLVTCWIVMCTYQF